MKKKFIKKLAAAALAASMVLTMLPVTAFADGNTDTDASESGVRYFSSTLYNWDETLANDATLQEDITISTSTAHTYKKVNQITSGTSYLIVNRQGYVLTRSTTTNSDNINGISNVSGTVIGDLIQGDYSNYLWTVQSRNSGGYRIRYFRGYNNYTYLRLNGSSVSTTNGGNDATTFTIKDLNTNNLFSIGSGDKYLDSYSSGFTAAYSGDPSSNANEQWYFFEYSGDENFKTPNGKGLYFTQDAKKFSTSFVPSFSTWEDNNQNWKIYSGLAASDLDNTSNAPFDTDVVAAAQLFAKDSNSASAIGAEMYTGVGVPYVYDSSTGYYELNSDIYGVYFKDGNAESNTNMLLADKPIAHSRDNKNAEFLTGFLPFNNITSNTRNATLSTSSSTKESYLIDGDAEFAFGMVTSVDFKIPVSGTIMDASEKEQDITFEFSGDDDVWVYVDNKLVLDIGGTHDAIQGTINFQSGDVILKAPAYDGIADRNTGAKGKSISQTNLYKVLGKDRETFASEDGVHTLTIYYMERGQGRSNCQIKFNLPQSDTVSVEKEVSEKKLSDEGNDETREIDLTDNDKAALDSKEYTFILYKNGQPVLDAAYTKRLANGVAVGKGKTNQTDGTFTLQEGQKAVFDVSLNGDRTYYVKEINPKDDTKDLYFADPTWQYSSNIKGAYHDKTIDDAWVSETYHAKGSFKTADTIAFICTNQLSYKPNAKAALVDDVVVIDYNLPVEVNVFDNDEFIGNIAELTISNGNYGDASFTADGNVIENNNVKYTLKKVLNEVDTVDYSVLAVDPQDGDVKQQGDATLSVVPASNVYYEDTFSAQVEGGDGIVGITYTGDWETIKGENSTEADLQSNENRVYGKDAAYADDLEYSNNTSTQLSHKATASFTFKGTGIDIYSTTDSDAAYIYAYLYEVAEVIDEDGNVILTDNLLQYALVDEFAASGTYYTVPTVTFEKLDPDNTYKVKIRVVAKSKEAINYVLDGIRVYNPLGTVTKDDPDDPNESVAYNAYAAADELNAAYTEIRSLLLDNAAAVAGEADNASGVVFIDESDGSYSFADYVYDGPKHEVYLNKGDGIAFQLTNFDPDGDAVYVGIKSAQGIAGKVTVTNGAGKVADIDITSTSDQYYRIYPDAQNRVVIVNNSDTETTENTVISLTKVRTTSADGNSIDFATVPSETLVNFTIAERVDYSGYYTSEDTASDETGGNSDTAEGEDADDDSADHNVEIEDDTTDNTDSNDDSPSENQNVFQLILNHFFGWIRGRR